jgi:Plasmid pRiA4b ORF-3-like protein
MTPDYQLKITLDEIKPPIWRRVVVPADISLAALHDVLQIAMGWTNSHLHAFEIAGHRYGRRDHADFAGDELLDERRHVLGALVGPRKRFMYEYDFGDGWEHHIIVEKELAAADKSPSIRCIDGARACPPEDCGGTYGYADLVDAITDPSHERHRELLDWVGEHFDAEAFNAAKVNTRLAKIVHKLKPAPRTRPANAARTRVARH